MGVVCASSENGLGWRIAINIAKPSGIGEAATVLVRMST
jgi:hypothetical protein